MRLLRCLPFSLALLACLPTSSAAQSNTINGLDVELGFVEGLTDAGHEGTYPNGRAGFAMATTSCNPGTVQAAWEAPMAPDHPFIAFIMARESSGRMVQISDHSHVKHGFFALSSNQCGYGCASTNGTALGIGCSDTYGVSNNGDRFWLGPAAEIDPWLGTWNPVGSLFDGTPVNGARDYNGNGLGSVENRIEVQDADLDVPGANFYYGAYYVVGHEAEANRNNNGGWRPVDINWNGSDYSVNSQGSNSPIDGSILDAWSGASVSSATNGAFDGRVFVASKVAAAGASARYEYAVHNRDSSRAVDTFRVPIAPGTQITNMGFHDVDQSAGNDWTMQVIGNEVVFSTTNNPILWNSFYNFWFDADAAPQSGSATVVPHFAGGGSNSYTIAAQVPTGGAFDPCALPDDSLEPNDSCAAAASVTSGAQGGLFVTKTDEDWYRVDTVDGSIVTVDLSFTHANGNLDAELFSTCGGSAIQVSNSTSDNEQLTVTNMTGGGQSYWVRVLVNPAASDDCNGYDLNVDIQGPGGGGCTYSDALEPNDACAAGVVLGSGTTNFLSVQKTNDDWYSIAVPSGVSLNVNTLFSTATADIDIFLYDACGGTELDQGFSGSDNENVSWTNNTGSTVQTKLRVEIWPNSSGDCNTYTLVIAGPPMADADMDGYTVAQGDCDDNNQAVNPGATEVCDGIDNNCDGSVDEGFDLDNDGYTVCEGDCNDSNPAVNPGATEICDGTDNNCDNQIDNVVDQDGDGVTICDGDCDDSDVTVFPGATEVCDGIDNNCDGNIDEGFDVDADGFTTCQGDCDDTNPSINPNATEVCDGIDNNCSGGVDEGFDVDGDGFTTCAGDCDDADPTVFPGATEVCDGIDNNCNGATDEGFDLDGDGWTICAGDCNDTNPTIFPGATEVCDGIDNNCNGATDEGFDVDGDGYTTCAGDCNDNNPTINPGATEICDGIDNNCNAMTDENSDQDGDGFTNCDGDCNDADNTIFPGAPELCDGVDNNCNGSTDEGFDVDGDGFTTCAGDCDDTNPAIRPGAPEVCDGIDNNCDGNTDEGFDVDGDGFTTCAGDCDDSDPAIHPGATEICDSIDNNCDGATDEGFDVDNDGFTSCEGDCNDSDPSINPGAAEVCDGIDNNCNGSTDEGFDSDNDGTADCFDGCPNDPNKIVPGQCGCNVPDDDSDGDGVADCLDNCPADMNPQQSDADGDGIGDLCDICPFEPDPLQLDCDGDGIGDACAIADGLSQDFNNNGVPDDCEFLESCNGDGGAMAGCGTCPCNNSTPLGTPGGCLNSAATPGHLYGSGVPSVMADSLRFELSGAPASAFSILTSGDGIAPLNMASPCFGLNSGIGAVQFDGLRCAVGNTLRHGGRSADANGDIGLTNNGWGPPSGPPIGLIAQGGFSSGQTRHYQVIYRDDPNLSCQRGLNTSNAVSVTFQP